MILYKNNNSKNSELRLRIGTGDKFTYDELQTFYNDELLEDFDLFQVTSKFFDDMYMYYFDGDYYLISQNKNIRQIEPEMLRGRRFTVASRSITNNVQHHVQLYGRESIDGLSNQEFLKILMGSAYKEPEQIKLQELSQELEK